MDQHFTVPPVQLVTKEAGRPLVFSRWNEKLHVYALRSAEKNVHHQISLLPGDKNLGPGLAQSPSRQGVTSSPP